MLQNYISELPAVNKDNQMGGLTCKFLALCTASKFDTVCTPVMINNSG
jgi:hypothetical protein